MKNRFYSVLMTSVLLLSAACFSGNGKANISTPPSGLLDTILPFVAKLHDSIPVRERFLPLHRGYMEKHKKERQYKVFRYTESSDSFVYFLLSRLEPSLKNDKFSAICGRMKRNASGKLDTASFEELFRTWKMKSDKMKFKSEQLFEKAIRHEDLSPYYPENSSGEWIEFPGNGVYYDAKNKSWTNRQNQF